MDIQSSIRGVQLNCRSINNKSYEIQAILDDFQLHFAALCETWITFHSPKFHGYHTYWVNRTSSIGGGVGFLIQIGLAHTELNLTPFQNGVLEVQAIKIFLKNNQSIAIMNVYNPNENFSETELKHFIDQLGNN